MQRELISGNSPWEPKIGFSRAVKVGSFIAVSGTTATGADGKIVGVGDVYAQTKQAILNIETALKKAGATLKDVVRTRIFLTEITTWQEAARAHGEFFSEIRPAATMVGVRGFVSADMLVEIEADAIIANLSA